MLAAAGERDKFLFRLPGDVKSTTDHLRLPPGAQSISLDKKIAPVQVAPASSSAANHTQRVGVSRLN